MELLVTGYAGESGSRDIYLNEETRKELLDRYPQSFFDVWKETGVCSAGLFSDCRDVVDCESAEEGGVLGALWRLMKRNRLGASFDQRKIPVRQQTIEICEQYGLDPYRMEAKNCFVILTQEAGPVFDTAERQGCVCRQIGFTEKGPAIRRIDGAAVSYLRRP